VNICRRASAALPTGLRARVRCGCADVDDPRNTDNAWMETTAVHFHCNEEQANAISSLLSAAVVRDVVWLDVDPVRSPRWKHMPLIAMHPI
jgi:hypothetical protein